MDFYSSIFCLSNHSDIWWFLYIDSPGYSNSSLNVQQCQQLTLQDKNNKQGGRTQIQLNPVGMQEISPPKSTQKTNPLSYEQF